MCCIDSAEVDNFVMDRDVRRGIRSEVLTHLCHDVDMDGIATAMRRTYEATGYDLGSESSRVAPEWFGEEQIDVPVLAPGAPGDHVYVVPRFAAAVVLALRSRLGRMEPTEANQLLVQREYLKICRTRGVRAVDVVSHQQHVANAMFNEDALDAIALSRSRLPSWLRGISGVKTVGGPRVC